MHHILITEEGASEVKSAETHTKFCDDPVDENLVIIFLFFANEHLTNLY